MTATLFSTVPLRILDARTGKASAYIPNEQANYLPSCPRLFYRPTASPSCPRSCVPDPLFESPRPKVSGDLPSFVQQVGPTFFAPGGQINPVPVSRSGDVMPAHTARLRIVAVVLLVNPVSAKLASGQVGRRNFHSVLRRSDGFGD